MKLSRIEQIRSLINELRSFNLNFNSYLDDSGYQELIDSVLEGKIRALKYYLNYLRMDILLKEFENIKFEKGKAVVNLEILQNFILNEVELELQNIKE